LCTSAAADSGLVRDGPSRTGAWTGNIRYGFWPTSTTIITYKSDQAVDWCDTLSKMVVLEKRETRKISFFVRGLKAGGPADSSNLVNERVNYDEVISVDFASTPQGSKSAC
jgi:hypothetical protein